MVLTGGKTGDNQRFGADGLGFGSTPLADPAAYPSFARCVAIFEAACERCAAAFRDASEAKLDATTKWAGSEVPLWSLAARMTFHNGTHCGQIADLRRALAMGSIAG